MRPRPLLLCALLLFAPLAGCASPDRRVGRGDVDAPIVSSLGGVGPSAEGAVNLTVGPGLAVASSPQNHTISLSLAPAVEASALHACAPPCPEGQVPPGTVVADAAVLAGNVSLNPRGPEGDSGVYFYDHGQAGSRWLRWADADGLFQLNGDLLVAGNLTAAKWVGTRTPILFSVLGSQTVVSFGTAALEGMEVAIFARGSGTLVNGTAIVALPDAFGYLAADGLITAQVTLTSRGPTLFVAEKATDHLRVEAADGSAPSGVTFDWFVQAPRQGGEGFEV